MTANLSPLVDHLLGDRPGHLAMFYGYDGYFPAGGRYAFARHEPRFYLWPGERERLSADVVAARAGRVDVYWCPALRTSQNRHGYGGKYGSNAVEPLYWLWADLDHALTPVQAALRATLDPIRVASGGGPDRLHVYLPLAEPVDIATHRRLNRTLAARLGADAKFSDESLLRLPGTVNHKTDAPVAALDGGGRAWSVAELDALLGPVDTAPSTPGPTVEPEGEPAPDPLPAIVAERLANTNTAERSGAHHALVAACKDAGLTLGQTVTVATGYGPSVEKYGDRLAKEVARSWDKIDATAHKGKAAALSYRASLLALGAVTARQPSLRAFYADGLALPDWWEAESPPEREPAAWVRDVPPDDNDEVVVATDRRYIIGPGPSNIRWLQHELGHRGLAGVFRRGSLPVICPLIGEQGYIPPRDPHDDNGPATVTTLGHERLTSLLVNGYPIHRIDEKTGQPREALFEIRQLRTALSDVDAAPNLRPIRGVTHTPMLRADGSLLQVAGYDEVTGFLLLPTVDVPAVAEEPTTADLTAATQLLRALVAEFRWRGEHDEANYLGLLLTPLLRLICPPPYKLGVIDAHERGSGKSLLAELLRIVHGGIVRGAMPADDGEMKKVIMGILDDTTAPVVTFDNVTGIVRSPTLAALLTSRVYSDRVLGSTNSVERVNDRLWTLTANNAAIGGDMPRRSIWVRIDPGMPNPELRTGFAIPNLPGYVQANRGAILAALLTWVRAWVAQGAPVPRGATSDSYGRWVGTVRGILGVAGIPGVFDHVDSREQAAGADDELGTLLAALADAFGARGWTVREVLDAVGWPRNPLPAEALPGDVGTKLGRTDRAGAAKTLGWWLANHQGQWSAGYRVKRVSKAGAKVVRWQLEQPAMRPEQAGQPS